MRIRLADRIAAHMIEEGITNCCWGDGFLVDVCRDHMSLENDHPIMVLTAACNAMERAPDLFKKWKIRAMDSRGHDRVVRAFGLKDDVKPRALSPGEKGT